VAKAVSAKTWSLTEDADGWIYSGPPSDSTPPTAGVLASLTSVTSTSFVARVSTPSVDAQTGVLDYVFYVAPNSTMTYVALPTVSPDVAVSGYTITGLAPSTAYSVKFKARDASPSLNVSADSNVVTATTSAAVANTSWFPNDPILDVCNCQGDITKNLMNDAEKDFCGERSVFMFQWFYPTNGRLSSRTTACSYIKTNYPGCHLIMYTEVFETVKTVSSPQNSAMEFLHDLIEGPNGNLNWYLNTASGLRTECRYSPSTQWQCNGSVLVAGLNSSGQRLDQAYYPALWASFNGGSPANFASTYLDGLFVDNLEAKHPTLTVNNGQSTSGGIPVTQQADMNADGTIDVRNNYASNSVTAGGKYWSDGCLAIKATIEDVIGPTRLVMPNGARWTYDYFDGSGSNPPLPLSSHPYYGKWEMPMKETVSNDFGLIPNQSALTYSFNGGGGADLAFRRMTMQQLFLKPNDSDSVTGRCCALLEARAVNRATLGTTDYDYARFFLGCALLMPRVAFCVNVAAVRPMPLDELIVELGNPIGQRSMGTLNETNLNWTLRAPDFTSGAAKFYWAIFEKGIVVVRLDSPAVGAWPSADSAVACTLPSAGSGKKWQSINAATYTSPAIYKGVGGTLVTRAMRSQNTTLNNGADRTSTPSLKPFQAVILRRVNA
jgi:hypothetical protein